MTQTEPSHTEQFFRKVCLDAKFVPDGAQRQDVMMFWLTAFARAVEHEAINRCMTAETLHIANWRGIPCDDCVGKAARELRRELLGG